MTTSCSLATLGQGCQTAFINGTIIITQEMGLCVQPQINSAICWDVCDLAHDASEYLVPDQGGNGTSVAYPMMVAMIRQGRHPLQCPNRMTTYFSCEPDNRCTTANIQREQGMCVNIPNAVPANQCLDMCDTRISLDVFKTLPGHKEGTKATVEAVRAGRDTGPFPVKCPGPQWWMFLWIPFILVCCAVGCLCFVLANKRLRSLHRKWSDREQEDYSYPQQTPFISNDQYRQEGADYGRVIDGEFRSDEELQYPQEVPPAVIEEVPMQQLPPDPLPAPVSQPPMMMPSTMPQTTSMSYSMPAQSPIGIMPQGIMPQGSSMYSNPGAVYGGQAAYPGAFASPIATIPPYR